MRQIWTNCHLYNKKETPIDRAGRQAEQLFSEKWNRSGFAAADARARRNNAGVAAPKFEPNEYGPPEKKLQRRTSGSKNGRTAARKVSHLVFSCSVSFVCCMLGTYMLKLLCPSHIEVHVSVCVVDVCMCCFLDAHMLET